MILEEVLRRLDEWDDDAVICVRMPVAPSSECVVVAPDENLGVPKRVQDDGFAYFLEVSVAREVLEVFGQKPASEEERAHLLIYYAENDAYPDWVYRR